MSLIDHVRRFIREHDLIGPGARVLAAVSGGSDSVALAYVLRDLEASGDLRLVALAHFNHQLRASAAEDERLAGEHARALGRPFQTDREDVAARSRRERRSIEDAARAARHAFLERARLETGADLVALGHTRDDQAETVLLRMVRGAGPRGLAGMHPRRDRIVRPLLGCRRDALRAWLLQQQIAFVDDESNRDVTIPRNRVRAELLPLLEARFNPSIVDVLSDEAELAREVSAWMEEECERFGPVINDLEVARLRAAPPGLARFVLWRALSGASGGRPIAFNHVRAVMRLMESGDGMLDLPGQRVQRIGPRLVLTSRDPGAVGRHAPDEVTNFFQYSLSIPGEVTLPDAHCVVSAETSGAAATTSGRATAGIGGEALVRRDLCGGSLVVRNRRPGDRFRPIGLGGRKKLQDFFVDRKVARRDRDDVPIVVDASGRIVWVAGYGIDEAFRVTDPGQAVIILKVRQA